MGSTIDKWLQQAWNTIIAIMYRYSPDVHKHKKTKVQHLMQRKQEWVYMVWATLQEPVQWVESMTCKGSGYLPSMMRLVHSLVYPRMMQKAMDPIDEAVCEYNERAGANDNH